MTNYNTIVIVNIIFYVTIKGLLQKSNNSRFLENVLFHEIKQKEEFPTSRCNNQINPLYISIDVYCIVLI